MAVVGGEGGEKDGTMFIIQTSWRLELAQAGTERKVSWSAAASQVGD